MRRAAGAVVALAACLLASCSPGPDDRALPDGVSGIVDQTRAERKTRTVFLRLDNQGGQALHVERMVLRSPRFDEPAVWTGDKEIGAGYQGDLRVDMPHGRCGGDTGATATITYRLGDDDALHRSELSADDPYQRARLFLDRDCAESVVESVATVSAGEPQVITSGERQVLSLPVTFTPTGASQDDDVRFVGFDSTVMFEQLEPDPPGGPLLLGRHPVTLDMRVVPARCDPHVIAEDKVGTLFGLRVAGSGLADDASFYLPLDDAMRTRLHQYVADACGMGR